ncbi:STAS domain-containing protein [Mycobacterium sp. URHB0021]|jgi:anti-anti-sigma factor
MQTSLTLDTARRTDGELVLTAAGEIDLSNIEAFKQSLTEAAGSSETVNLDFAAVEYVDSAAINVLFAHADNIHKLIAHPLLMNILSVSGLTELVTIEAAPPTAGR